MDRYDLAAAIISTGPPGAVSADGGQARDLARSINEDLGALTAAEPLRFAALATLPLPDLDAALGELAHALDELSLDGVWLPSNVGGVYLGDPALEPLFAELDRRGAYVFVHPTFAPYPSPLPLPDWLIEFPFDTTRAIVSLLYSGTFDRCQRIRFHFAHLGGTAPFLLDRIASLVQRDPRFRERLREEPETYLARFWFDTALNNREYAIACTIAVAPLERLLFGTDWPYATLPGGGDPAPELDGFGADRARLELANIAALVPRFAQLRSS